MQEKLMPCPCCDETKSLFFYDYPTGTFAVCCANCGMRGPALGYSKEDATRTWNALPRRLRFSKEKPTEPGWYWHGKYKPSIVRVVTPSSGRMFYCISGYPDQYDVLNDDGEWAGPIQEPEEE